MASLEQVSRQKLSEGINVPKLEMLVRLGLLPLKLLPILRRALDRIQGGVPLTPDDRKVISMLLDRMLSLSLNDTTAYQRLRVLATQQKANTMEETNISEDRRREELKRMPEGMLDTLASNVRVKLRSGGKISPSDKSIASRAKAELRRRRDNKKRLKEDYQNAFNIILSEYNIDNISELSSDQAKEFFHKVETLYKSGE